MLINQSQLSSIIKTLYKVVENFCDCYDGDTFENVSIEQTECFKTVYSIVNRHLYSLNDGGIQYVISEQAISGIILEIVNTYSEQMIESDYSLSLKNIKEVIIGSFQRGVNPVSKFYENECEYLNKMKQAAEKEHGVKYIEPEFKPNTDLYRLLKNRNSATPSPLLLPQDIFACNLSPSLSRVIEDYCYTTNTTDYRLDVLRDKKLEQILTNKFQFSQQV